MRSKPPGCAAATTSCDFSTGGSRRRKCTHRAPRARRVAGHRRRRHAARRAPRGAAVATDPTHDAARLALADAIYRQCRYRDALEVLAASTAVDDRARTEVIIARGKALWGLGRLDDAEIILLDAGSTITDHRCLGWVQGFRATVRAACSAFRPRASRSHSRSPTTPPTGHAPPRRAWDR